MADMDVDKQPAAGADKGKTKDGKKRFEVKKVSSRAPKRDEIHITE